MKVLIVSFRFAPFNSIGTNRINELSNYFEKQNIDFSNLIVMETGGMKGRRKEIVREELHEILRDGFGVSKIHSEYGMTELLSQAYSF